MLPYRPLDPVHFDIQCLGRSALLSRFRTESKLSLQPGPRPRVPLRQYQDFLL